MSNENVIKSIEAIDNVILTEQAKFRKILDIRKDLVSKYHFKCQGCGGNFKLKSYKYMRAHSVDLDSDWHYCDIPTWDKLVCSKCDHKNNISGEELIKVIDWTVFEKLENFNHSRY